jgi:hypothetical protein
MTQQPTMFVGSSGPAVEVLVGLLRAQGFWPSTAGPAEFTPELELAVKDFQRTHIGPDKAFLSADGVIGPNTWWALHHPSGRDQQSGIVATIPVGVGPRRRRVLEVALSEHAKGVAEQPDGSNRGPDVERYLPTWVREGSAAGPPWCCFFYSWVVREALGEWPLGARVGSCAQARSRAGQRSLWKPKSMAGSEPIPGDAFVMDRGGGHGHIGFVLRVSEDGKQINTVEGNCGNRVKLGLRSLADPEIVGYIAVVEDEPTTAFERGIVLVDNVQRQARV